MNESVADLERNIEEKSVTIRELCIKLAEKEEQIEEMSVERTEIKDCMKKKDEKIQQLTTTVAEKHKQIGELTVEIAELKDIVIQKEDLHRHELLVQAHEIRNTLREKEDSIKRLKESASELALETDRKIHELSACLEERGVELEKSAHQIQELKKRVDQLEEELLIHKQLKNTKKLRELEKLGGKSVELEGIMDKIRQETACIAIRLADRARCQSSVVTGATAPSTKSSLPSELSLSVTNRVTWFCKTAFCVG